MPTITPMIQNMYDNQSTFSNPILLAAHDGSVNSTEIFSLLLESGADVNSKDPALG